MLGSADPTARATGLQNQALPTPCAAAVVGVCPTGSTGSTAGAPELSVITHHDELQAVWGWALTLLSTLLHGAVPLQLGWERQGLEGKLLQEEEKDRKNPGQAQ